MKILITTKSRLPADKYGGTERVIWSLGKELHKLGHSVVFLAAPGSRCPFAKILNYYEKSDLRNIIPNDIDIVHFNSDIPSDCQFPYIVTQHGNCQKGSTLDRQTVFVSSNHAARHGSKVYVHNGLDWSNVDLVDSPRTDFHFLGKAAWRRKNVKGAISSTMQVKKVKLHVLGGHRLNLSMGFRFTANPRVKFHGMVDDVYKYSLMQKSKGLIFPVRWNEPFGLAIAESLYCGCPVFGTPYGSLPEIVSKEVGFLSNSSSGLASAIRDSDSWSKDYCHEYASEKFNSLKMALSYTELYDKVLSGGVLNEKNPTTSENPNTPLLWLD